MNPIKLLCCAALALAVVSAQSTTTAPSTNSTTAEITVTKDQLDAIIKEVKDAAGKDPEFAALLESIDLDALLKLTPEQVRKVLNDKLFGTIDSSSSGSGTGTKDTVTTAPPSTDAISTKSPSVPAPGGSSAASSVATASITTLAAGVVVTVFYL